jgi:mannose-1-phosphate guanylyltransferase
LIQESLGRVVWQPENRGTGPGVFLPLSYIRSHDPHATVVLWPSDHFIFPVEPMLQVIRDAAALVQEQPQRMVLLTVPPQSREQDYGWVIPEGAVCLNLEEFRSGRCGGLWRNRWGPSLGTLP